MKLNTRKFLVQRLRIRGVIPPTRRSLWPLGLRRRSATARLLRFPYRTPSGAWKSVACECRVVSGGDLCEGPIPRPEESNEKWLL